MMSMEVLSKTFYYCETSPTYLRWARESYSGRDYCKLQVKVGDVAGSLNQRGHYEVYFEGRLQQVHRIVYMLHNGEIPEGLVIDHINRNCADNNIKNLRAISRKENTRNQSGRVNNTSGYTGIIFTDGGYRASVQGLDGRRLSKYFSTDKYGEIGAKTLAINWRKNQLEILNNNGANYHPTHGDLN